MIHARRLFAVAALAVALAGCGDSDPAAAPSSPAAAPTSVAAVTPSSASPSPTSSPTPSLSPPPADGGTYSSPPLIIEALEKGGITCTGYTGVAEPRGALARGSCHVDGEEYTIGIYKTAAQARQQPRTEAELLAGVADVDLVLGKNWTVGCPNEVSCRSVASVLGGEVFHQDK